MKTTFWNILSNTNETISVPNGILIPKIQRDYAQGRITTRANEIRNEFLKNIKDAIIEFKKDNTKGLDLDFVYGTSELGSFVPLDGQQRLTTLFLLHWYLAFKESKISDFLPVLSKFHYETRPSSNEFLKCLCTKINETDFDQIFNNNKSFDEIIKNENWYYASWNHDNTIQAMITMLKSIHSDFADTNISITDLIVEKECAITFNFLQLDTFGLSDSLYIKMNARGKQLTSFENLKAQLAKLIKESYYNNAYNYTLKTLSGEKAVDVETYFVTQVDTVWTDYFWSLRDENNNFDNQLLNLLTFISLNETIIQDVNKYNNAISDFESIDTISYYALNKNELLFEKGLISYIDILDVLCSKDESIVRFFEATDFIKSSVIPTFGDGIGANYERRVLFYGIFKFLLKYQNNLAYDELFKWYKLLQNLTTNTIYDSSDNLKASLAGVNDFLDIYSGNLYLDFINNSIKGFDSIQTREEVIKLHLKLKSQEWTDLIESIEKHGFLKGQISSLLVFSGIVKASENNGLQNLSELDLANLFVGLNHKSKIFNSIFNEDGLKKFEKEEFRRALLTFGDFAIYSTNWFFYNNSNHRDLSWRRLLKETINLGQTYKVGATALIELFDSLVVETDVESQLNALIINYLNDSTEKGWKYYFIKYPSLFLASKKHYVKFYGLDEDEYIYCLNKTKYNFAVDYDFMSLVLKSELFKKDFNLSSIQYEFSTKYNQFGISKIKGKSVKIVYNSHLKRHTFIIKAHGCEEFYEKSLQKVVNYIIENYS